MDQTWCFVYSSAQKDGKVIYHYFGRILMDFTSVYSSISGVAIKPSIFGDDFDPSPRETPGAGQAETLESVTR